MIAERLRLPTLETEIEFSFARPGLAKLGGAVAYEPKFDQREGLKPSYLSKQIDTFLGERLNILLSTNNYEIKNNLMWGEDMDEPFINVIKRGVEYRQQVGGTNRVDKKREEAELEGFLKTQEIMCNPNTEVGTMMLSVSPKGAKDSLYQHNFYDIFTLKEESGEKFVEARRYSSALSQDEYKEKLSLFYPKLYGKDVQVDDAYFLSHPVGINPSTSLRIFQNADQLHSYLHKNHEVMGTAEFQRIIEKCEGLKQIYIGTRNPKVLDAIMNKADREAGLVNYDHLVGQNRLFDLKIDQEIDFFGGQKVRPVAAGCGPSKSTSPFSVSEFAMEDKYGDREFPCPECGKTNRRPKDTLISNCQHCGSNKVAC